MFSSWGVPTNLGQPAQGQGVSAANIGSGGFMPSMGMGIGAQGGPGNNSNSWGSPSAGKPMAPGASNESGPVASWAENVQQGSKAPNRPGIKKQVTPGAQPTNPATTPQAMPPNTYNPNGRMGANVPDNQKNPITPWAPAQFVPSVAPAQPTAQGSRMSPSYGGVDPAKRAAYISRLSPDDQEFMRQVDMDSASRAGNRSGQNVLKTESPSARERAFKIQQAMYREMGM